jgi:hypothetical protein
MFGEFVLQKFAQFIGVGHPVDEHSILIGLQSHSVLEGLPNPEA